MVQLRLRSILNGFGSTQPVFEINLRRSYSHCVNEEKPITAVFDTKHTMTLVPNSLTETYKWIH